MEDTLTKEIDCVLCKAKYSPIIEPDEEEILFDSNLTRVFDDFTSNNIRFIVSLTPDHAFYESYITNYESQYPFLQNLSPEFVDQIFFNSEFVLWQIIP